MSDALDLFEQFISTPHEEAPAWMNDYFTEISRALSRANQTTLVEPIHVEPYRKYDGLMIFADGTDFDPGRGRGMYYWDSVVDDWVSINVTSLISEILQLFTAAGYGGVKQNTPVAIADITATPQIIPTNAGAVATPLQITQDFANDGIRFLFRGTFVLSLSLSLEHNDVNNGRNFAIQLYNQTTGSLIATTLVGVGRNQAGTNYSTTLIAEITDSEVGDLVVGRLVSVADTFSAVVVDGYVINAWSVGTAFNL